MVASRTINMIPIRNTATENTTTHSMSGFLYSLHSPKCSAIDSEYSTGNHDGSDATSKCQDRVHVRV